MHDASKRLVIITATVGSVDREPIIVDSVLWTNIWHHDPCLKELAPDGRFLVPPGYVLHVEAVLLPEADRQAEVDKAREGPLQTENQVVRWLSDADLDS